MSPAEVLIVFHCKTGAAESLALAAAVGAVQARAMIRLRRVPDVDSGDSDEALTRMRKEYVAPAEADVIRANALIFVAHANFSEDAEWKEHFGLLVRLKHEGKLTGKFAAVLGETREAGDALTQTIGRFGLT